MDADCQEAECGLFIVFLLKGMKFMKNESDAYLPGRSIYEATVTKMV